MRWNRQGNPEDNKAEVNLTPLIDVSLVLVVILLLATPLAFESSFGVRKTADTARRASQEKREARIELAIQTDEVVLVNRRAVPMADLDAALKPLMKDATSRRVTVRCANGVTHGTFVHVLDVTKLNGATDIAIAGS